MAEPFLMFLFSVYTYIYLRTVPNRYIIGKPFQSVDYLYHSISTGTLSLEHVHFFLTFCYCPSQTVRVNYVISF